MAVLLPTSPEPMRKLYPLAKRLARSRISSWVWKLTKKSTFEQMQDLFVHAGGRKVEGHYYYLVHASPSVRDFISFQ